MENNKIYIVKVEIQDKWINVCIINNKISKCTLASSVARPMQISQYIKGVKCTSCYSCKAN